MINWIKVWWHCLIHFFKFDFEPPHLMCMTSIRLENGFKMRKDYCSCGYNNEGITWNEEIEKFKKQSNIK